MVVFFVWYIVINYKLVFNYGFFMVWEYILDINIE